MKKKANIKVINAPLRIGFACPGCGSILFREFSGNLLCVNVDECKYKEGFFDVPTIPMFWTADAQLSPKPKKVKGRKKN